MPLFFVILAHMDTLPTIEPVTAVANDTLTWQKSLPDYLPSNGWMLTYALRGPDSTDIQATPSGTSYLATTPAPAITGTYSLQGYVTKGQERHVIYSGVLIVSVDLSKVELSATYDARSQNQRILDAIDAVLEKRASQSQQDTTIDGTRIVRIPHTDLLRMRGIYASKVWRDNNPGLLGPKINISFSGRY